MTTNFTGRRWEVTLRSEAAEVAGVIRQENEHREAAAEADQRRIEAALDTYPDAAKVRRILDDLARRGRVTKCVVQIPCGRTGTRPCIDSYRSLFGRQLPPCVRGSQAEHGQQGV